LQRYSAVVEADTFKSMSEARKIWSDVVHVVGDGVKPWLEYAQLEANFGSIKHQRKVYQRAIERVREDPSEIAEAWLTFERLEGDLDQVEECEAKCESKMRKWRQSSKDSGNDAAAQQQLKGKNASPSAGKKNRNDVNKRKRKSDESEGKSQEEPVFKRPSLTRSQPPSATDNPATTSAGKKVIKPPPGFKEPELPKNLAGKKPPPGYAERLQEKVIMPPLGYNENKEKSKTAVKPPPGWTGDASSAGENLQDNDEKKRTVFLSNLDFSVTEEEIKLALNHLQDTIQEVRMVKNYAGKSKGFCYVKLTDVSAAQKALGLDHTLSIKNRPVFISEFKEDKSLPAEFKFSKVMEKNKLFVSNIGTSTTKEYLEKLFSSVEGGSETLKEVRLVTYRNGHSKGIAYVEFKEEEAAAKALLKTDGMLVGGKEISVAISRPPPRKDGKQQQGPSLGAGPSKDTFLGPRGRGRSQLSMVPRSVATAKTDKDPTASSSANGSNGSSIPPPPPKSNADFRSMLLGSSTKKA